MCVKKEGDVFSLKVNKLDRDEYGFPSQGSPLMVE